MLKSYEEYDVEYPDSSSLSIRDLHYTAAQHITGRGGLAFHVIGQASLIAQSLHLYREQSVSRNDPIESQLLRLTFWHLHLSDKASACLKNRGGVLHESSFRGKLNLHPRGEPFVPLLDSSKPWYGKSFEERLLVGFHLMERLWSSAARLVIGMGVYEATEDAKEPLVMRLTTVYYDFIEIMDGLPHWLKISSLIALPEDGSVEVFQKKSFWVQRCTLTMTFHCLRLIILQECIEKGFLELIGLDEQPLRVAMKKAEWIQDFIETMEDIPFTYHQIKGEPSVSQLNPNID
jgi:hypothetical protein